MEREVVIRGVGACTERAGSADELWECVKIPPTPPFSKGEIKAKEGRILALSATTEALNSARLYKENKTSNETFRRLNFDAINPRRLGITLSASKPLFEVDGSILAPDVIGDELCRQLGIEGERRNVIAACATGA